MNNRTVLKIRKKLITWYDTNQRKLPWRKTKKPYLIWVSEVMLQQTQVKTVIPYYEKFIKKFPEIEVLAEADIQEVLKLWEGLGYYARARNFHKAAKIIAAAYNGVIPAEYDAFRALPGVGDYIAAAVLSISFGHPLPVVDGNVKRVLARLFLIDTPVNKSTNHGVFSTYAEQLLEKRQADIYNQAIMELGALVCTPKNPQCAKCPVVRECSAFRSQKISEFPKRLKTKPAPLVHMVAGIVERNGYFLIVQRKSQGLLGGLWDFPGGNVQKGDSPQKTCESSIKKEVNLVVKVNEFIVQVRHAYTHFKIIMDVYKCDYVSGRVRLKEHTDFKWIKLARLDKYPLPGAVLKIFPYLFIK